MVALSCVVFMAMLVALPICTELVASEFVSSNNSESSGSLKTGTFAIPASQSELRISEIHFNPAEPTTAEFNTGFEDNDDFEFIELFNPSTGVINLNGVTALQWNHLRIWRC